MADMTYPTIRKLLPAGSKIFTIESIHFGLDRPTLVFYTEGDVAFVRDAIFDGKTLQLVKDEGYNAMMDDGFGDESPIMAAREIGPQFKRKLIDGKFKPLSESDRLVLEILFEEEDTRIFKQVAIGLDVVLLKSQEQKKNKWKAVDARQWSLTDEIVHLLLDFPRARIEEIRGMEQEVLNWSNVEHILTTIQGIVPEAPRSSQTGRLFMSLLSTLSNQLSMLDYHPEYGPLYQETKEILRGSILQNS